MSGQDPQQLKKHYEDNNMMFALRDSLLADRAMELVYDHARIEEVDPAQGAEPGPVSGEEGTAHSQDETSDS
jgi:trigger factor